ncbi:MAG: hypothetical protein Athens071416_627 [Parcubacteria group bacterium Athens0714_16]|nr:MAG: hypothetical protein Athens071416_627 [Parcubacteria group bacterium Athens0714_16]
MALQFKPRKFTCSLKKFLDIKIKDRVEDNKHEKYFFVLEAKKQILFTDISRRIRIFVKKDGYDLSQENPKMGYVLFVNCDKKLYVGINNNSGPSKHGFGERIILELVFSKN